MDAFWEPRALRPLKIWTRLGLVVGTLLFVMAIANLAVALTDPGHLWDAVFFERLGGSAVPLLLAGSALWSFPAVGRTRIGVRYRLGRPLPFLMTRQRP